MFSSRADIFDSNLRKKFLSSSPSTKYSNLPVTVSPNSVIASKIPSVASILSLSSFKCFSRLLVISSSMKHPSNSTTLFNFMSSKGLFTGVFKPSVEIVFIYNMLFF